MSFLASAGRKTTDIRGFLREVAGNNSLKYRAEQGKKHYIHIPCITVPVQDEEGNITMQKQIIAQYGEVHEWETPDGKYKATICLKDVIRKAEDGTVLNDGSCPICDRVGDAWDIYKYRCELEEKTCGLTGEALTRHMEGVKGANGMVEVPGFKKQAADERKAKDANPYLYLLIVQYRTDNNGTPVLNQNGNPEYDLRVMKLSKSRVEKLQQQIENSGMQMEGCDIVIEYPKEAENLMLVVSKSTTAPVFPDASITYKKNPQTQQLMYPTLTQAIANDVAKFVWDGLEKSFPEWAGMTSAEAEKTVNGLFEMWDTYKKELAVNPNARYLEYAGASANNNPALGAGAPAVGGAMLTGSAPQVPGAAPQVPGAAPMVPGSVPQVPNAAPQVPGAAPQVPGSAPVTGGPGQIPDANAIFGGGGSINI